MIEKPFSRFLNQSFEMKIVAVASMQSCSTIRQYAMIGLMRLTLSSYDSEATEAL